VDVGIQRTTVGETRAAKIEPRHRVSRTWSTIGTASSAPSPVWWLAWSPAPWRRTLRADAAAVSILAAAVGTVTAAEELFE
jgi:hypothetical protein